MTIIKSVCSTLINTRKLKISKTNPYHSSKVNLHPRYQKSVEIVNFNEMVGGVIDVLNVQAQRIEEEKLKVY